MRRGIRSFAIAAVFIATAGVSHAVPVVTLSASPSPVKEGKNFVLTTAGTYEPDVTTTIYLYDYYRFDPGVGWVRLYVGPEAAINTVAPAVAPGGQTYQYLVYAYNTYNQPGYAFFTQPVVDNPVPVANAGPAQSTREFRPGVQLKGSGTDDEPGISFAWTQTAGTAVALSNAAAAQPTFTAPFAAQTLVFQLVVTDRDGATSAPSSTSVNVQANVAPASVNAGPDQEVAQESVVTLHGVATDPNTDPLSYSWKQISGPRTLTINGAAAADANFRSPTVTADETYVFRLDVTDGAATQSDETTILVKAVGGAASGIPLVSNQKTYPSPFNPSRGNATIRYTLRSPSDVNMLISDIFGRQVREIRVSAGTQGGSAGDNDVPWDGRNGEGDMVSNGIYIVQVAAKDVFGAQGKVTDRVGVRR